MNTLAQQLEQHYVDLGPTLLGYFRQQKSLATAADDLLQETFARAWRDRARLRRAASPRAYIFGIARHVCLDALRRLHRSEPLAEAAAEPPPEPDERLVLLRAAIKALPLTHREPLELKLQQELTYAEIADVLQLPVGTVRSRLHYAIRRLHETLNPTGIGDTTPLL